MKKLHLVVLIHCYENKTKKTRISVRKRSNAMKLNFAILAKKLWYQNDLREHLSRRYCLVVIKGFKLSVLCCSALNLTEFSSTAVLLKTQRRVNGLALNVFLQNAT